MASVQETTPASDLQTIAIIGFMGSGKSTTGEILACLLGYDFVDTDREIERKYLMPVTEIFSKFGEDAFRTYETNILNEIFPLPYTVISCGGGIVISDENRKILKRHALVVWLDCPAETCISRCTCGSRPLLDGGDPFTTARALLKKREPLYSEMADIIINCDGMDAFSVAGAIADKIPGQP